MGSVCVEEMLERGFNVTVFDNLTEGHRGAVDPRATFIQGDLDDPKSIALALETTEPDAVMHFAANALVPESMVNPFKYFHNNVCGGLNLLQAMSERKLQRLVFSSTCATYGLPDQVPIEESTPQNPINPYGESKLMFEKILRWFSQIHGLIFTSLRYFNAAGASEKFGEQHRVESHLIPRVLQVPLGLAEPAEVFGLDYPTPDGSCIRDYIHVRDLAEAHILALKAEHSGFYNLGTGGGTSVLEVVQACRDATGHDIPVVERPRRPGDPARLVASSEKAKSELGWTPRFTDIDSIVQSAWQWHRRHPRGYGE